MAATRAAVTDNQSINNNMSLDSLLKNGEAARRSDSDSDSEISDISSSYDDILLDTVIPHYVVAHDLLDCDLRLYVKDFPLDVY
jgi:hypothetical protein